MRFGFQHSGDRDADEDMNVDLLQVPSKAVWMAFSASIANLQAADIYLTCFGTLTVVKLFVAGFDLVGLFHGPLAYRCQIPKKHFFLY